MTSDGLPGMWERADFERGKTDAEVGPSDLSVPASQPNPSSEPKVTVTGVDGVTRIVQGVEGEIPDGVEYTFGPCDTCGEMFCEHERVSQPVVSSSRAVDLDLDQIEARANAATAGPWQEFYGSMSDGEQRYYVGQVGPTVSVNDVTGDGMPRADAEFIAHAREDVPRLVAEVRRLRGWLDTYRSDLGRARDERNAARAEAEELRQAYRTVCDYAAQHDATRAELNEAVAEAARVREALQAIRSPEAIERAAEALYEEGRPDTYTGEEWDWPNIDHAYDWDGDHDERGNPEGQSPEWLRDRYRAEARAALDAALDGETNG